MVLALARRVAPATARAGAGAGAEAGARAGAGAAAGTSVGVFVACVRHAARGWHQPPVEAVFLLPQLQLYEDQVLHSLVQGFPESEMIRSGGGGDVGSGNGHTK